MTFTAPLPEFWDMLVKGFESIIKICFGHWRIPEQSS
jgi:hypothetical protein